MTNQQLADAIREKFLSEDKELSTTDFGEFVLDFIEAYPAFKPTPGQVCSHKEFGDVIVIGRHPKVADYWGVVTTYMITLSSMVYWVTTSDLSSINTWAGHTMTATEQGQMS